MGVVASLRQEQASLRAPGYAFYTPRPDCLRLRYRGKHVVLQAISQKVVRGCHTYVHGGMDKIFLLCDRKCFSQIQIYASWSGGAVGQVRCVSSLSPRLGSNMGSPRFTPSLMTLSLVWP